MFRDKVIVITGSSQGIGFRTAELLAQQGANVIINSRNEEKVVNATRRITDQGFKALGIAGDVSDFDFCQRLREQVFQAFGRIDMLINNAGVAAKGKLKDTRPEVYRSIFEINVLGSLFPTQAMIDDLRASKGSILFISSIAGILGLPSYSAYSGTKGAIIKLAESLKNELLDDGVFVGVNHPGFTENDPQKTTISGSGERVVMSKRTDVKVEPLDKTVGSIISQLKSRRFRVFSSLSGRMVFLIYRISPMLALFALKLNRRKIMEME
jgi:NAD(P)-dependent dehydrogenase (short-subunit alcohol dehydrogenase family)